MLAENEARNVFHRLFRSFDQQGDQVLLFLGFDREDIDERQDVWALFDGWHRNDLSIRDQPFCSCCII